MKPFWKTVSVAPAHDGFAILLDGRPVKLPGRVPLTAPFEPLAAAIAAEWAQAGGARDFTPDDLPLTRLAGTAQARVAAARGETIDQLTAYGLNDLLCYRADGQPALAAKEHQAWQPWLDWAAQTCGAALIVTSGMMPVDQTAECRAALQAALAGLDDYQLSGLGVIVPALGSLVLGLAIQAGALHASAACEVAQMGQIWQEGFWGADAEAVKQRQAVMDDVETAARFMLLCRT